MFVRIINDTAVDATDKDPFELYVESIAQEFITVPDYVQAGWKLVNGEWTSPDPHPVVPDNPVLTLENAKARRLEELSQAFFVAEKAGHLVSSLGFEVDATERANRDVSGLIVTMSAPNAPATTYFCDYNNEMRPVALESLKIIQLEIIAYGQALYARKWQLRAQIEAAETVEVLNGININFDTIPIQ